MIKHILWDWNGTLLNDTHLVWDLGNVQLSEAGLPHLTLEQFRQEFSHPVLEYYHRIGLRVTPEEFAEMSLHFHSLYRKRLTEVALHREVDVVLRALQELGLPQSILSAYPQAFLNSVVAQFGISPYFCQILGLPDQLGISKVQAGKDWLMAAELRPGEVVMIGDTNHDFEVAEALGAHCILIANGFQSRSRLESCGAVLIDSLANVPEVVKELLR